MRFQWLLAVLMVLSLTCVAWSQGGQDDVKLMEGTWLPASAELSGKELPEEVRKIIKLVLKGDTYTVTVGDQPDEGKVKVDATKKPKTLDITGTKGANMGKTMLAIYEVNGDTLRVCYDMSGKAYPKDFKTTPDSQLFLVTYKRQKGQP